MLPEPTPQDEILDRVLAIQQQAGAPPDAMDEQEKAEREAAAQAYAGENERHFVDYLTDCVDTSVRAMREVREVQDECWRMYNEEEPLTFRHKEDWQSRIVVPKPFNSVQFAAASIKKTFAPQFLSVEDARNPTAGDFWKKQMEFYLSRSQGSFPARYVDAVVMALAIGQSLELIPVWRQGRGLMFDMVEPWKIHRDPDAPARDAQGGLYWIHQEWLDSFVLKAGEQSGKYFDVGRATETGTARADDPFMTQEAIARRKSQIFQRSSFRPMVLTSEFWGTVLGPKGELLLPSATFTVAGGRVIKKPQAVRYRRLRWPGISFSPLPNLLRFGGRGLLEGVRSIWEAMCNLMCLHEDAIKWLVNPMTEINVQALVDPSDVATWPGKEYLVNETMNGQQAVRSVLRRDVTGSVLANIQYHDQNYQRGTAVTDAVQGLPGYRKDVTWRESEQNLGQALGVFSLMGEALEDGAVEVIRAAQEVVMAHAGYQDYAQVMDERELATFGLMPSLQVEPGRPGVIGVPLMSGSWRVSGIQQLMKDNETVSTLREIMLPLAGAPVFAPYIMPYNVLRALERRTGLADEETIVPRELGERIQLQQKAAMLAPPAPPAPAPDGGQSGAGPGQEAGNAQ